ncbi:MAG TPA: GAF domain-containing protein, partial [Myxococcales bacterium]|nr:GAF domain-containing protein [Myxococcales bacterium]
MNQRELDELVGQIPMAACLVRAAQVIACNDRMVELTGHARAVIAAAKSVIDAFVAEEEREAVQARYLARMRGEAVPDEYDFHIRAPGGRILPARMRVSRFPLAGPDVYLALFSDERIRERSADMIRGLVEVAVAAQGQRTESGFFAAVRERLHALGLPATLLEIEGSRFRRSPFAPPIAEVGTEVHAAMDGWRPLADLPVDVSRGESTLIEDLPGFLAGLSGRPAVAFRDRIAGRGMLATIRIDGEPRYVLSCSGDGIDSAVASGFALLARQLGAALETRRQLEELDRRNAELTLLLDLGREVIGALEVGQVLTAAARTAARTLRCSCAYVFLPEGNALKVAAREDPHPPPTVSLGTELPIEAGWLTGLAFRHQRAYTSTDTASDLRVDADIVARFDCQATLAVPLLSHGRSLGVLALFERGTRMFDEQDVRLASHAAQLTAAALENARLYSEQRARAEEMALLNDVARRLAGSLELSPLLALGGETLQKLLDGEHWFVMLPDAAAGGLRFHPNLPPAHADLANRVLRFDEPSTAALAFRERRVVQMLDPLSSPGTASRELALRFGNRPALAVPLMARDQCLGVAVILGRQMRAFSPADMERALAVAGQLGLALLSARLFQDLRQSYAELARTQKELIDRERLAALGELSAVIAHEVRNPLGVIFNSVGSLRRLLSPQGDVRLLLDIVGEEADRLNRMVGDLLDYSRPMQPALAEVAVRPLVEESLAAARQQIGAAAEQVKVHVRVAADAATVQADARLLRQALINLFLNAHQAMPRGGRMEVRALRGEHEGRPWADLVVS